MTTANVIDAEFHDIAPDKRREAMERKIELRLNDATAKFGSALDSIQSQQELLRDRIVPLGRGGKIHFASEPNRLVAVVNNGSEEVFGLHPHAATQAGEKLGAPGAYMRELAFSPEPWKRELAAEILNRSALHGPRQRVLVRAVGDQVRGVLSDSYRRLNSGVIVRNLIEAAGATGLRLFRAEAEDTQIMVEFLLPQVFEVQLPNHGREFLSWGARYTNSDFGDGASALSIVENRCRCLNLMICESAIRTVHLGARLPDNIQISERTYDYDTKTQASLVKDTVKGLLTVQAIEQRIDTLSGAAEKIVDVDDTIKDLVRVGATKTEAENVRKVMTENNNAVVPEGPATQYKLAQALSAVAQQADNAARRRDLEALAGKVLTRK